MPTGIYNHKKHTKERCENISKALTGKKRTQEFKDKMSGIHSKDKNWNWKGDDAVKITNHIFVAKYKPKPKCCEKCGQERKLNLANIKNHMYTKNLEDYKWLCYSCHKKMDMKCSYCSKNDCKLSLRMVCDDCYKKGFSIWKENFIRLLKEDIKKIESVRFDSFSNEQILAIPKIVWDKWKEKIDKLAGLQLIK